MGVLRVEKLIRKLYVVALRKADFPMWKLRPRQINIHFRLWLPRISSPHFLPDDFMR